MGSTGVSTSTTFPKYSNENGVITNDVVKKDSRYQAVVNELATIGKKYRARDIMRTIMKAEENGQTSGSLYVLDTESASDRRKSGITFGKELTTISRALKVAGYKVTKRENDDMRSRGYTGARGRYNYASTTKARTLYFEKI